MFSRVEVGAGNSIHLREAQRLMENRLRTFLDGGMMAQMR
jgi:hypothetical protein